MVQLCSHPLREDLRLDNSKVRAWLRRAGGPQEWSLTDAIYERMIATITRFGHALERRPASARLLLPDEETLRDWLMFLLSTNYQAPGGSELFVGGETVDGNGKTDILIRHQDRNAFIGECKFWHGPKRFGEAIDQLLGYTVWRDTKGSDHLVHYEPERHRRHRQRRRMPADASPVQDVADTRRSRRAPRLRFRLTARRTARNLPGPPSCNPPWNQLDQRPRQPKNAPSVRSYCGHERCGGQRNP